MKLEVTRSESADIFKEIQGVVGSGGRIF